MATIYTIARKNVQLRQIEYYVLKDSQLSSGLEDGVEFSDETLKSIRGKDEEIQILFMPPIGDDAGIYDLDKEEKTSGWTNKYPEPHYSTVEILQETYGIPEWFFRNIGWNMNGFSGSAVREAADAIGEVEHHWYARFLGKEVKSDRNSIDYGWIFMAFYLISFDISAERKRTILFCFDLPTRLRDTVKTVLQQQTVCSRGGFSMLAPIMLNAVMIELEQNVWSFQTPVRALEKRRAEVMSKPSGEQGEVQKVGQMENNYRDIYNLLRHALHISESLTVAAETLRVLHLEAEYQIEGLEDGIKPNFEQASSLRMLKFSSHLASSLKQRASAFVERLNNEATIVGNFTSTRLLEQTIRGDTQEAQSDTKLLQDVGKILGQIEQALQETRNEGAQLVQRFTSISILILPATLVAGFFGMNFFTINDKGKLTIVREIYLFGIFTFFITIISWSYAKSWGSLLKQKFKRTPPTTDQTRNGVELTDRNKSTAAK